MAKAASSLGDIQKSGLAEIDARVASASLASTRERLAAIRGEFSADVDAVTEMASLQTARTEELAKQIAPTGEWGFKLMQTCTIIATSLVPNSERLESRLKDADTALE